jgi:hypothetical protein
MLDPSPKFFMGDSRSYIATAVSGWIPPDRSFFYGYVIRWLAVWTSSLTPLLIFQTLVGAMTAIMVAAICRGAFGLPPLLSFAAGLACCFDPLQLLWERYVMTETISLFFYVAVLHFSFLYLKHRGLRHLAIAQGFSILLIGFRMSYLLVVQASAVLLPILAFSPLLLTTWRSSQGDRGKRLRVMKLAFVHLLTSIALMVILHGAYKQVNGLLCNREPGYLYATGFHLLAFWAPILTPADASDQRLAQIIEEGDEFDIKDLTARNAQRFAPGHLVDKWQKVEQDRARANQIGKETALRALRRNPLQVLRLAAQTFAQYWSLKDLRHYGRIDLGHDLTPEQISILAERFHLATDGRITNAPLTVLQHYLLLSWPYCYFLLLSPIVGVSAVYLAREKQLALLLLVHLVIILTVTFTFAVAPSFRYLQPASVLTLLTVALCLRAFLKSRSPETPALSS